MHPPWDHGQVSLPQYPGPEQFGRPGGPGSWEQPGLVPLRPMALGQILGVGWAVVRRHLMPLGGAGLLVAGLSAIATLGTLVASGSLQTYADGRWLDDLLGGRSTALPAGILFSTLLGLLVSTIGAPVVAGLATAFAGAAALGRDGRGAVAERLRGRWPVLLGVAVIVGVLVAVGLMVLVVPGVIAYVILVFAAPVAVMERAAVSPALRRSSLLTRGHRGRILGAVALTLVIGTVAGAIGSGVVGALIGQAGTVTALVVSQFVAALLGGLAAAWTGAVVAVLYIDVRIRTEHLDQALRAAATRINRGGPSGR